MICCLWCDSTDTQQIIADKTIYHQCLSCEIVYMDSKHHLDLKAEEARYLLHQNNVTDIGYQNFVSPLKNAVLERFNENHVGLDFGSGKDSAISYLLNQKNYKVNKYDPFFQPDKIVLKTNTYDYIVVCEVAEHFYNPKFEFIKLKSYLKPHGILFVMTSLITADVDFKTWSYRRDSTHVCFYTDKTFKTEFKTEVLTNNLILLHNCERSAKNKDSKVKDLK